MNNENSNDALRELLESSPVTSSAPCRIDMGGTLDIKTFYLPLQYLTPITVNMALDMRTSVQLLPHDAGRVKITSRGFESAEFPLDTVPFDHPLGLMFAVAAYFRAGGVHIKIESASPPRSALGGSSTAAVALMGAFDGAFSKLGPKSGLTRGQIAHLAHAIEESVAGVPCGFQDQLAAAYGGVNQWQWKEEGGGSVFERTPLLPDNMLPEFGRHLLVAYCGIPHESKDVNGRWVRQFISGRYRDRWVKIIGYAHDFARAIKTGDMDLAISSMNREMQIRKELTPDVLDEMGSLLVTAALEGNCGARISGAGAGGCIWAMGGAEDIRQLEQTWRTLLNTRKDAALLDVNLDPAGLLV